MNIITFIDWSSEPSWKLYPYGGTDHLGMFVF